jgi:hypothetical protein
MLDKTVPMYFVLGYVITYLALETVSHFSTYKIPDKTIYVYVDA